MTVAWTYVYKVGFFYVLKNVDLQITIVVDKVKFHIIWQNE